MSDAGTRPGSAEERGPIISRIQARIALVLIVACIPAVLTYAVYASYRFHEEKKGAIEHLQRQARSIALTRGVLLDQTKALLRSLASVPQVRNMSLEPNACSAVLRWAQQMSGTYANIGAADMEGRIVCNAFTSVAQSQTHNVADRPWFQRVVARRDFVVGNHATGKASGEDSIHTAYPIFDDHDRMIGAVAGGVRLSWLAGRIAALDLPRGIVVELLDSEGAILLRHPPLKTAAPSGRTSPELTLLTAEKKSLRAEVKMSDGVVRTVAIEPLGGIGGSDIAVVVAAEPDYLSASAWKQAHVHVDALLVLLASVSATLLALHRMVIQPVRSLEATVNAYRSGDHAARAKAADVYELGHLAGTFNAMVDKLSREESALRDASAQKSAYLAIASHDLRQPLQTVMIGLESAAKDAQGNVRTGLMRAQRAAERLHEQLDLLADVVRAERLGAGRQQISAIPISELFKRAREAHWEAAAAKGLGVHVIESSLIVKSNPEALFTIVNNFVMNAVNYTEKGRVVIGCRRVGKRCRIEVHDTGPGIPQESRARIFEPFHRLDPEAAAGLGLGLTIARETAALLGHAISMHSTRGRGSCFCVEVPLWNGSNHDDQSSRDR